MKRYNKRMKTYLSIDIDYWFCNDNNFNYIPTNLYTLFNSINSKSKIIVRDHERLLPHINELEVERIIHIDHHQDIAYPYDKDDTVEFNCGTFWYFLKNRKDIEFHWICPYKICKTDSEGICMDMSRTKPFNSKNWIFKKQTVKTGLSGYKQFEEMNIVGIGVALSPAYCYTSTSNLNEVIEMLVKKGYINNTDYPQSLRPRHGGYYASECTV